MPRLRRPIREARQILDEFKVTKAPVPVEKIAKRLAHLAYERLPEEISGVLLPLETGVGTKPWAILINEEHHANRQRFTIAHECGHLLMHNIVAPHADNTFQVRFRDSKSSDGTVLDEIEANQFAAELLMPESLLLKRLKALGFDYGGSHSEEEEDEAMVQLRKVATEFGVSLQALQLRLLNLQDEMF